LGDDLDQYYKYIAILVGFGFIVTYLLIPAMKRLAVAYGFLSYPGGRKLHGNAIPVLGGVAIFAPHLVLFSGYLYLVGVGSALIDHDTVPQFISVFAGTLWVLFVGLIDDRANLGWRKKLAGQIFGVMIVLIGGNSIGKIVIPFYGLIDTGALGYPILGFIILLVMNAINLIDGMDGLAGGICFFASLTCGILAFAKGNLLVTAICFTLAGSLVAFLRFNFPPASIFMGDSGSLSMGFMLSIFATSDIVKGSGSRYTTLTTLLALLLPFAIALIDVALAIARRWISGRKIFLPDADHIHHRFMEMFQRPRLVIGIFYIFSALFCSVTLLINLNPGSSLPWIIAGVSIIGLVAIMALVLHVNRIDRLTKAIKNRQDCQFLSTFNSYMEARLRRVKSHDELVLLMEVGVRDLDLLKVEVNLNGYQPHVWNNPRDIHPDSPKKTGLRNFKDSDLLVKWVVPTHDDPSYQKYLELVWWRFLSAVEEKNRLLERCERRHE
jgi:UDP-GlcNAc:undecaprenyl-phosphate GlcNAc-1-phosphate transferase